MLNKVEKIIAARILPEIKEKGRKNFDYNHTRAVVYWIKKIISQINNKEIDKLILVTSAYAHDWGYINLFKDIEINLEANMERKKLHMMKGAKMISSYLKKDLASYFTKKQINRIVHLVKIHDQVEKVKDEDEILLMEADTLGTLDVKRIKPTFSKKDNDLFLKREIYNRRLLYFKHPYALKMAKKLAEERKEYYLNNNFFK